MNTIVIAQIKKDLVPLRNWMIALLVITCLGVLLTVLSWQPNVSVKVNRGGDLLPFIILAVVIVRVIHQDSLVDPGAYWRTRPISREQLLQAKAGLVLPVFVIYVLFSQPWRNAEALGHFLTAGVFFAGLAAFASVTSKFSRMVAMVFAAFFAAAAALMAVGMLGGIVLAIFPQLGSWPMPWRTENFALGRDVLVIGGFLGLTIYQYLTMNSRRAAFLISAWCFLAVCFSMNFSVGK